jgi:hypothetical protein
MLTVVSWVIIPGKTMAMVDFGCSRICYLFDME